MKGGGGGGKEARRCGRPTRKPLLSSPLPLLRYREIDPALVATISEDEIRPVNKQDFMRARERIKASVTPQVRRGERALPAAPVRWL